MSSEVIHASSAGCSGGKSDDTSDFWALINSVPLGARIVLGNNRYTIKSGGSLNKPITIEGGGPRSEIYWNPTTSGDTLLSASALTASIPNKNEEGQLYGPTIRNLRVLGKREIRADVFNFWRVDNAHFDNVFVEGIKGSSLILNGSRETHIDGFRTRFCGDRDTQTPDIQIISTTGYDTSNYQMWTNLFSIFPFWDGLHLDNADKIMVSNLMMHMYPTAGTPEFLAPFHSYATGRFGSDLYQSWLDHFNDATTGGVHAVPIRALNGSTLNISGIQLVGGSQNELVRADNSQIHIENGWVVGANSAAGGALFSADNTGVVTWDQIFLDGTNQIFKSANGGSCGGYGRIGPSFSATQDLEQLGVNERWYGGNINLYRLMRFLKNAEFGDASNIAFGTAAGTKIGTASDQKLAFYGANPVTRPSSTAPIATDAATTQNLANDLRAKLLALGLIS